MEIFETLEETWQRQDSILSNFENIGPRGLEYYPSNEFYGIDLIVKKLLGMDSSQRLKIALPHGAEIGDWGPANNFFGNLDLSTLVYTNDIGLENLIKNRVPGFRIRAEHPFLLLLHLMQERGLLTKNLRPGTLFYPAHRDYYYKFTNRDYDEILVGELVNRVNDVGQIYVSLPLIDIKLGRHEVYERRGFQVVSCGSRYDPKFLTRFINLANSFTNLATSEIGSHLFYGAALGIPFDIWSSKLGRLQNAQSLGSKVKIEGRLHPSVADQLFRQERISEDYARHILGYTEFREDNDLVSSWELIHRKAIYRDKFAVWVPKGKFRTSKIPSSTKRFLKSFKAARKLNKQLKSLFVC